MSSESTPYCPFGTLAQPPLKLLSVTQDSNGADATGQVTGMSFHLVTGLTQLTG